MVPHTLNELPNGTQAALDLIADFDKCFVAGFANLDRQNQQTLNTLQQVFAGTPLQQPLTDTCAAIQRNEFLERHFTVLAAVRAALTGSLFDSLQQHVRSALGRTDLPEANAENEQSELPAHVQVWQMSVRHWLMEIALVGYTRLDASALVPFMTTLEQIQAEPLLIRQAALLTGFFNEMMSLVPIADSSKIPARRWVDLWTQAMVNTLCPAVQHSSELVSGTLELLGLDLRHHPNLVSFTAYGLLTYDNQVQLVRVTLSAYKVDAINSEEIWLLFPEAFPLLDAFAQTKALHLNDIPLLSTGDLLWHGEGKLGSKYNLMQKASEFFAANSSKVAAPCLIHPSQRHPVQLAEPVFLSDYTILKDTTSWESNIAGTGTLPITNEHTTALSLSWSDEGTLPVAMERVSLMSEVNLEAIANSTQLFGLLRFDAGRWAVQPLAVATQGKPIFTGQKAAKLLKSPPKTSTVSTLQERASRLLRAK